MPRPPARSRDFSVHRVAPGAWAAIARDGGYGLCNAGILDLGGLTVVFDSMLTPMAGAALAKAAERLTGRRPDVVVNSHWHGDHVRGNGSFLPALIVATSKTRRLLATRGRRQWSDDRRTMARALRKLDAPSSDVPPYERAQYRGWFAGTLAVPLPFSLVLPTLTFEREVRFRGSKRELRVVTFGGGHSPSDVFAYLPDERVAILGDLLSVGVHPSAGDGVPRAWAQILSKVRKLGIAAAVPGHGPVGGSKEIAQLERYLRHLDRTAHANVRAGRSLGEHLRSPVPAPFRSWRFSAFYRENLARSFQLARRNAVRP